MTTARLLAALVLLAVVGVAGPAPAVGELDGVYFLTVTGPSSDPVTLVLLVTQSGQEIVIVVLDPLDSSWFFLFGGLNADQQVTGPLFFGDGLEAGALTAHFQGPAVTGTITLFAAESAFSGSKVF